MPSIPRAAVPDARRGIAQSSRAATMRLRLGPCRAESSYELLRCEKAVALRQKFPNFFPVGRGVIGEHHGDKTRPPTWVEGMADGNQEIVFLPCVKCDDREMLVVVSVGPEVGQRPAADAPVNPFVGLLLVRLRQMSARGTDTADDCVRHINWVRHESRGVEATAQMPIVAGGELCSRRASNPYHGTALGRRVPGIRRGGLRVGWRTRCEPQRVVRRQSVPSRLPIRRPSRTAAQPGCRTRL